MLQQLHFSDFEVLVHLGCSPDEQKKAQMVLTSVVITFAEFVSGAASDNLEEVIDYVEMTEIIKQVAQKKAYHLIEHLNHQILESLLIYLKSQKIKATVKLNIKKIKVPVSGLRNGVEFSCEAKL